MTPDDFRRLVLAHRGVVEGAHHGHADFRVNGKVIASLRTQAGAQTGAPKETLAMVRVTPDEQKTLISDAPGVFSPEAGAWGRQGYTRIDLAAADDETVGPAVTMAVRRAATAGRSTRRRDGY